MIPNEAKQQFQEIITHEMFEMNRTFGAVLGATHASMIARGLGQSGPAMQALAQDAINSLKARAQFILGQLLRCLTAHHVELTAETVAEASTLLRDAIQTEAQMVRGRLFGNPIFHVPGLERARQQIQAQYDQEGPRLIARLSNELKLAAAAATMLAAPSQGAPSFTFLGPVGLVQTGNGSQATVHQHIDAGLRNEIASASVGKSARSLAAAEVLRCFQCQGSSSCSWEMGHSRKAFYAHPAKDRERGGISTEQIDTHVIVIISEIIGMVECSFDVIGR